MSTNNKKNRTIKSLSTFLVLGLLTGFVGFTYAKYISSYFSTSNNGAAAAQWGTIEIREHIVESSSDDEGEDNIKYYFSKETYPIENNSETLFTNIRAGMNIPFYPCVFLSGTFEVSFWLYLKVVETDYNESTPIEYHIDLEDSWVMKGKPLTQKGITTTIYRYKATLPSVGEKFEEEKEIKILEHNSLHVSKDFDVEKFEGFDLKFSAWIEQLRDNDNK